MAQEKHCDVAVRADWLVTQDSERTILRDGGLAVSQGRVAGVGPWAEISQEFSAAETVDLGRSLLLPGLVNSHTHAPMALLRGLADDTELMDWLHNHIFPVESRHTPETVQLGALLACAEMIASGTTTFCDMHFFADRVAEAADQSGIRAFVGEAVFGFPTPAYKDWRGALERMRALHADYNGHGRVNVLVPAHAVYTTTPEMLAESRALARELGCGWAIHLAETESETAQCLKQFGKRPFEHLRDLDLLGEDTLLAHCVELNQEEIAALARYGCHVAHNPSSNMKLASGAAPVPAMLEHSLNVGLGTDGAASNNCLNMFLEMRACALLHKAVAKDPTLVPAQTVLDMATRNGGRCLGVEGLGALAPGSPADAVALDLDRPNLVPLYNPVSHLVYAATGGEVRFTMVDGKILYRDGRFTTIDYPGLLREMEAVRTWVLKK